MPVDAGWALAGLSLPSFVHSHLMVQKRQQSYKASVAHKHFAKRLRRAVQQQRSCALLRAYGLCFWNFVQTYSRRLSSPAHIKKENWSCMLTGKPVFLSYTYSMSDLVLRNSFPYKSCRFFIFYHTFCMILFV